MREKGRQKERTRTSTVHTKRKLNPARQSNPPHAAKEKGSLKRKLIVNHGKRRRLEEKSIQKQEGREDTIQLLVYLNIQQERTPWRKKDEKNPPSESLDNLLTTKERKKYERKKEIRKRGGGSVLIAREFMSSMGGVIWMEVRGNLRRGVGECESSSHGRVARAPCGKGKGKGRKDFF